jgi:hypothetical protein
LLTRRERGAHLAHVGVVIVGAFAGLLISPARREIGDATNLVPAQQAQLLKQARTQP